MSGGHLSPGITIAAVLFKKFPPSKAAGYIIAQILGAFVACLVIYVQYHDLIKTISQALEAQGALDKINFTPQGIAGSFALYAPVGSSLGNVFLNEFVCVSAPRNLPIPLQLFTFMSDFHPRYGYLGLRRPNQLLRPYFSLFRGHRPRLCHDHLGLRSRGHCREHGS